MKKKTHNTHRGDFIRPPHTTVPAKSTYTPTPDSLHNNSSESTTREAESESTKQKQAGLNYLDLWGLRWPNMFINRFYNKYNIYVEIASFNFPRLIWKHRRADDAYIKHLFHSFAALWMCVNQYAQSLLCMACSIVGWWTTAPHTQKSHAI